YDTAVGEDVELADLEEEFDAIFIGVGLGPDNELPVEGTDLDGVVGAVEFIRKLKVEPEYELPDDLERVAVVGGGNTAIDVVREMSRLGVDDVMLVYRRDEASMSGYDHEWKGAKQEGGRGIWRAQPTAILGDERVEGLGCRRTRTDEQGELEILEGTEFDIDCQAVVLAIGQSMLGDLFEDVEGLELDWGRIVVDPETGRTGNPMYYAGGDCANGGEEVVNAVQEAKIAARGIDDYLEKAER
ncbi:MAG: FAD-dependent oxidoreductase, partial [Bradymonadaceae bacterium]